MSWGVIFTGAVCLLAAIAVAFIGIWIRKDIPWLPAVSIVVDFGIIFGGMKALLDATKTANELRKIGLEIDKLRLEIQERKRIAEKENAYVTLATLVEIEQYAKTPALKSTRPSISWQKIASGTTVITVLLVAGLYYSARKQNSSTQAPTIPPTSYPETAIQLPGRITPSPVAPNEPPPLPNIKPPLPPEIQRLSLACGADQNMRARLTVTPDSQTLVLSGHSLRFLSDSDLQEDDFIELVDPRIVLGKRGQKQRNIFLAPNRQRTYVRSSQDWIYPQTFRSREKISGLLSDYAFYVRGKVLNLSKVSGYDLWAFKRGSSITFNIPCG